MRLTRRGERLLAWAALTGFLALLGIAGHIQTLGT